MQNQHRLKTKIKIGIFRNYLISKRAANGARTRDPQLGKLMLYQLSYCRINIPKIMP